MTVQNVIVKNIYAGNGSNTSWPYTFACPENHPEFIKAYIKDPEGNVHQTEDFKVDTSTKTVTYPVTGKVLSAEEKIVIARELPLYQVLNLVNQGPFFAEDVEVTFDELVMMIQQLNEQLGRSLKVGIDIDQEKEIDITIPVPTDDGNYGLRITKNGFELVNDPSSVYDDTVAAMKKAEKANSEAQNANSEAQNAADLSRAWAEEIPEDENQLLPIGHNSSKFWANSIHGKYDGEFPYVTPEMFGAVGDGVTDDTLAVQAAFDSANVNGYDVIGIKNYMVTNTITVNDGIGTVDFSGTICAAFEDKPIVLLNALFTKKVALHVEGAEINGGYTYNDDAKLNLSLIGIQAKNCNKCTFNFIVLNCHIGVQLLGDKAGCCDNYVNLPMLRNNVISLDLNAINKGWVNENLYPISAFSNTSANTDKDKNVGIRIWSADSSYNYNNNNVFIKPAFEMGGLPIWIVGGRNNTFRECRAENGKIPYMKLDYGYSNFFSAAMSAGNNSVTRENIIQENINSGSNDVFIRGFLPELPLIPIWEYTYDKHDWLGQLARASANYGRFYHKKLDVVNATTGVLVDTDTNISMDIASDEHSFSNRSNYWGIHVDVSSNKRFFMKIKTKDISVDVRMALVLYDENFNVIDATTDMVGNNYVSTLNKNGVSLRSNASYNNNSLVLINVLNDACKYIFVGVNALSSTNHLGLEQMQLYTTINSYKDVLQPCFKRRAGFEAFNITDTSLLQGFFYVGQYLPLSNLTEKTDATGTYITKGYLCTTIAEDGIPTWVEDKMYTSFAASAKTSTNTQQII